MPIFKGHPKDGKKRFDYIERKIDFLRQIGLVERKSTGFGFNGGAAPDHLTKAQKEEREEWRKFRDRQLEQSRQQSGDGPYFTSPIEAVR